MAPEVAEVFRRVFQLQDHFSLDGQMTYTDVPGWDSVGHLNLVNELEQRFGIAFEVEEIVELDSVGKVFEVVASKRAP